MESRDIKVVNGERIHELIEQFYEKWNEYIGISLKVSVDNIEPASNPSHKEILEELEYAIQARDVSIEFGVDRIQELKSKGIQVSEDNFLQKLQELIGTQEKLILETEELLNLSLVEIYNRESQRVAKEGQKPWDLNNQLLGRIIAKETSDSYFTQRDEQMRNWAADLTTNLLNKTNSFFRETENWLKECAKRGMQRANLMGTLREASRSYSEQNQFAQYIQQEAQKDNQQLESDFPQSELD